MQKKIDIETKQNQGKIIIQVKNTWYDEIMIRGPKLATMNIVHGIWLILSDRWTMKSTVLAAEHWQIDV